MTQVQDGKMAWSRNDDPQFSSRMAWFVNEKKKTRIISYLYILDAFLVMF